LLFSRLATGVTQGYQRKVAKCTKQNEDMSLPD
jgi:ribosomal protein S18